MRNCHPVVRLSVLICAALWSCFAFAAHVRVFVGGPLFWPGYYYPAPYYAPYAYYPRAVEVPLAPTTYVERESNETAPQRAAGYWYYCADPKGYYPYIKQCGAGWQRVSPEPSAH